MKVLLLALSIFALGFRHHHAVKDPDPGHSHQGEAFDEGPRQFAKIFDGAGEHIHFEAEGCLEATQPFINQAVGQLHGFLNFESERSFRHAAYLDPNCAFAYWGMAMANTLWAANPARAKAFIAEARRRLNSESSQRLRWYVEAIEATQQGFSGQVTYLNKLKQIWQNFPDDLDAKAFFIVEVWNRKMQNQMGFVGHDYRSTNLAVDELAREVLAVNPHHPVHHYIIHLWDNPNDFSLALSSADQSGFAASSVAHLWHMSGHTYSQARLYFEKWWSQEAAARIDHQYMQDMHVFPFMLHNHAHNNEWFTRTLMDLGDFGKALKMSFNMLAQPRHPTFNTGLDDYRHLQNGLDRGLEVLERGDYWELTVKLMSSPILDCDQFRNLAANYSKCLRIGKLAEIITGTPLHLAETMEPDYLDETALVSQLMAGDTSALRKLQRLRHLQSGWGLHSLTKYAMRAKQYHEASELADTLVQEDPKNPAFLLLASSAYAMAASSSKAKSYFERALPISQNIDLESPVMQSITANLRTLWPDLADDWRQPYQGWREIHQSRPELSAMGPLLWQPFQMENFKWIDKHGRWHELNRERGNKASIVVFLLNDCPQCDMQYKRLESYQAEMDALGVSLVAVTAQSENMPAFKSVGAYDDFESLPIHGLFIVNDTNDIVWQDLSASAFMDIEYLMSDLPRLIHPYHRHVLRGDFENLQ